MKKRNLTDLLIFIVSAELVGVLSALLSGGFSQMYLSLEKPPFSPPGWVFPVVWSVLYALMGISAYLVYRTEFNPSVRKKGLTAYVIQLFLNFLWSIIYFRFEMFTLALIDLILLTVAVIIMTVLFGRVSKTAAWINIPYILWLLFATYLNIGTIVLN